MKRITPKFPQSHFYMVKGGESSAAPKLTGYFDIDEYKKPEYVHKHWVGTFPNGGDMTHTVVQGKGTKSKFADQIGGGAKPLYSSGKLQWDLKWLYQLPGHLVTVDGIEFADVEQVNVLTLDLGPPKTLIISAGKGKPGAAPPDRIQVESLPTNVE